MAAQIFSVQCCIAGGGPAGLMAGLLLARAGVEVLVLEKHADFLRDFRGDMIHPSTLEVMHELKLAELLLKLPHSKVRSLSFHAGDETLTIADFSSLALRYPFIAIMPQWDFLNFIAKEAARNAGFNLIMQAEATGLIEENGRIVGLRAKQANGGIDVRADLVIAADGRHSILRDQAGLKTNTLGAPIDVLWFALPRAQADPHEIAGYLGAGEVFIMIDRGEHWQCGFVIAKGSGDALRVRGIDEFRNRVARLVRILRDRLAAVDWDDIKLLTVVVDRLVQWYRPGLVCIGDAAHAMSPIGGVGINLAIQDAVAAANILGAALRENRLHIEHLRQLQHRRELPTRITQLFQVFVQNRILAPILRGGPAPRPPLPMRVIARFPSLQRRIAQYIGEGVRAEHVQKQPSRRRV